MSISFYISEPERACFSYKAVETPLSLVSLVEGLEVVGLEGDKAYQSLDQVGTFLAVYWEGAGRGFEVYYLPDRGNLPGSCLDTIDGRRLERGHSLHESFGSEDEAGYCR